MGCQTTVGQGIEGVIFNRRFGICYIQQGRQIRSLPENTHQIILDNLRENRRGKTTILIAHRISTIEQMDKVVFIDDGAIVDVGTHTELYARCTAYRDMVEMQRLDDHKEGGERA